MVDPDTFCAWLASQLRQPDAAADDVAIVTVSLTGLTRAGQSGQRVERPD